MSDEPKVTKMTILALVTENDPDFYEPDDAYIFSNHRVFKSTDNMNAGVYANWDPLPWTLGTRARVR